MINGVAILVFILCFVPIIAISAEGVITETVMREILNETGDAALRNDYYGAIKYYYPESRMVYDLDPDPALGKIELGYDEFIPQIQLDLGALQDSEVSEEVLEVWVAEDGKSGETITRTKIVHTLFGTRTETLSDTLTRFLVVDGEIKIVFEETELLRYEQTK